MAACHPERSAGSLECLNRRESLRRGAPHLAEYVVFAGQVTSARIQCGLPGDVVAEHQAIEDVTAPAADTVVIRWRELYHDAATPTLRALGPLPKHILADPLDRIAADPQ